ncbi:MAG: S41 family peptidase [Anaerolineae bacterium]
MIRSILLGLGIGVLLALVFAAGFLLSDQLDAQAIAAPASAGDYELLDEVQGLLDRYYVREQPNYRQREYGAIRGLLNTLNDPYTFFVEPSTAASESDVLAGTYGGVGVQVVRGSPDELILYPFADGPAAAAGIQAEDRLLKVNGQNLDSTISLDIIDQLLRGEVKSGSGVTMTVQRGDEELDFFVEFAVINVPSVVWRMLDDEIGYLQVMRFSARTPDELNTAAQALLNAGARGIVLDLRNNAGGLLQESIQAADVFVDEGVLVYEVSPTGERSFDSTSNGLLADLPLRVLVNGRTASGAEIVAGAIRDSGRGLLVGERTYGKGTVQQILALSDTSSLHVTSSEWFTPTRRPLDKVGLEPDVTVTPDPTGVDNQLAAAVEGVQVELTLQGAGTT